MEKVGFPNKMKQLYKLLKEQNVRIQSKKLK